MFACVCAGKFFLHIYTSAYSHMELHVCTHTFIDGRQEVAAFVSDATCSAPGCGRGRADLRAAEDARHGLQGAKGAPELADGNCPELAATWVPILWFRL